MSRPRFFAATPRLPAIRSSGRSGATRPARWNGMSARSCRDLPRSWPSPIATGNISRGCTASGTSRRFRREWTSTTLPLGRVQRRRMAMAEWWCLPARWIGWRTSTASSSSWTRYGRLSPERDRGRKLDWEFTGFVDDVRPFVHNAQVYVIPLRVGGGTRIKVYEAMAMGYQVVSTRIGIEGLPVEHDRHYLEADSPDSMAAAVLSLLDDRERRARLSLQARKYVEENMSARRAARVFEQICLRALQTANAIEASGTTAGVARTTPSIQ